ncbi:unnamed protein product, partial [Cylicostephanus goldi]
MDSRALLRTRLVYGNMGWIRSDNAKEKIEFQNLPGHYLELQNVNNAPILDSACKKRKCSRIANSLGKLPSNHPARHLPPVDLLFLVDSSSSIGISNFETAIERIQSALIQIKTNIANVLEDVDIGPGRSRIALIQYALQPSVVFGFDKYYSLKSVQSNANGGLERMSYTGGATMLSKALSFAAGV